GQSWHPNRNRCTVPRTQPLCFQRGEGVEPYNMYGSRRAKRSLPYFFRRATTRTFRVCEIAPTVSASLIISACSCWCRLPDPVAGLALSDRPTYRNSRRVSFSSGCMYSRTTRHAPILRGSSCAHTTSADGLYWAEDRAPGRRRTGKVVPRG